VPDILDEIDGALAAWETGPDAMRHGTAQLPDLSERQRRVAAHLMAATGMDGFATAMAITDVLTYGSGSPLFDEVAAATRTVIAEDQAKILAGWRGPSVSLVIIDEVSPKLDALIEYFFARYRSGPPPLPIDGHAYRRRQLARRRRRRHG
jgi:hypothetical protein